MTKKTKRPRVAPFQWRTIAGQMLGLADIGDDHLVNRVPVDEPAPQGLGNESWGRRERARRERARHMAGDDPTRHTAVARPRSSAGPKRKYLDATLVLAAQRGVVVAPIAPTARAKR